MSKISFMHSTPARSIWAYLILILFLISPVLSYAWDGLDYETGNYIEIDDSDISSLAPGAIIQIYDNEDSDHHIVEVMTIVKTTDETNIEVYDQDTDEYRTFEMEGMEIRVKACMVQNNHTLA